MVVALEVHKERVFAAYGDGKIRVWRRTWDGDFKHVRLATIPRTGSYVRNYIARKDKMVMLDAFDLHYNYGLLKMIYIGNYA